MAANVSKTTIANLALSHMRDKGLVQDFDADTSPQAKTARLWYDPARRQALSEYDWHFARTRVTLSSHTLDPPDTWAYRYQYPSNCIQARAIENPLGRDEPPVPFDIEQASDGTQSILTDQDEAVLVFTRDEMQPTFFTPHFIMALSYLMAYYMAGPTTGKQSIQRLTFEAYKYNAGLGAAIQANVTSIATEGARDAPWHSYRNA